MYYDKVIKVNVEIGQSCCIIPKKNWKENVSEKKYDRNLSIVIKGILSVQYIFEMNNMGIILSAVYFIENLCCIAS